ncbi:hypothetical protein OY671_008790, partial [Metschnikowia pulcherrima]
AGYFTEAQKARVSESADSQKRCFDSFAQYAGADASAAWERSEQSAGPVSRSRDMASRTSEAERVDAGSAESWFGSCTERIDAMRAVESSSAEASTHGEKVLVCGPYVFWYEEDGSIGWQVKMTHSDRVSEGATVWKEGTILSTNHGRLVILPYIKEDGEKVRGHTRNAPGDGKALPRHPDHFADIPFREISGDLMIGLFGESPYE